MATVGDTTLWRWLTEDALDLDRWFQVADADYLALLASLDLDALFPPRTRRPRLLDVGCGTGRFPGLLRSRLDRPSTTIDYDYLDPSPYCRRGLREGLRPPFQTGQELAERAEDLGTGQGPSGAPYDVVWAIHSLYYGSVAGVPGTLRRLRALLESYLQKCVLDASCPLTGSRRRSRSFDSVLGRPERSVRGGVPRRNGKRGSRFPFPGSWAVRFTRSNRREPLTSESWEPSSRPPPPKGGGARGDRNRDRRSVQAPCLAGDRPGPLARSSRACRFPLRRRAARRGRASPEASRGMRVKRRFP